MLVSSRRSPTWLRKSELLCNSCTTGDGGVFEKGSPRGDSMRCMPVVWVTVPAVWYFEPRQFDELT
jgi:hypothetical protein